MTSHRAPRPRARGPLTVLLALAPGLLLASGCGPAEQARAEQQAVRPSYDVLIRDGTLVDGSGAPARAADVLLIGDRIAHVGPVDPDTLDVGETFDAAGLVVAPGFIDLHAHGEPTGGEPPDNFLAMGVTSIVLGQDGSSPPAGELAEAIEALRRAPPSVNVAYFVGHNTIRQESGVGFGAPDAEGLARMQALVARAMDAGALGLSTGLEYSPGRLADLDELVAIAEPVAARGGVVASHVRSEDLAEVEASVQELLDQGRRSGADVHVSHMKIVLGDDPAVAHRILGRMAEARAAGLRVTGDVYPYLASFTGLSILFPDWALPPADYASVARTRRSELLAHLRARVEARNGPGAMLFGTGRWTGRTLEEVAGETGRPFEEVLADLGPRGASAAYFVMDEDVLRVFLTDPWVAIASDGSPTMSHPRGYGSFARVIRRYVVEQRVLSLEEAIRKMTSLPASILGMDQPARTTLPVGLVRAGWAADLVAFDPEEVRDPASFEEPHRLAEGMRRVWVSGRPALRDGAPVADARYGRVLVPTTPALPPAGPGY